MPDSAAQSRRGDGASDDNITVCGRFRPLNQLELDKGGKYCVKFQPEGKVNSVEVQCTDDDVAHRFALKKFFDCESKQDDVYLELGSPVVRDVMRGYNGTILAYGQTGSGKTYTMYGQGKVSGRPPTPPPAQQQYEAGGMMSPGASTRRPSVYTEVAPQMDMTYDMEGPSSGVVPRAVRELFQMIDEADPNTKFEVSFTFVEVYMERVRDLLDPTKSNLQLREDIASKSFYVEGSATYYVTSPTEILDLMDVGNRNRSTASTRMNEMSSRSHSIAGIVVRSVNAVLGVQQCGKLFFVDLAGSEKVAKTMASGVKLEEAKLINKSLTTLSLVISTLADRKAQHIPYRDSKLTRLLQDSLGGNARTTLIVCCSPSAYNDMETISTLRFGGRAANVRNHAVVNKEQTMDELRAMLAHAEGELAKWRNGAHGAPSGHNDSGGSAVDLSAATVEGVAIDVSPASPPPPSHLQQRVDELELELRDRDEAVAGLNLEIRDHTRRAVSAANSSVVDRIRLESLAEEIGVWQDEYAGATRATARVQHTLGVEQTAGGVLRATLHQAHQALSSVQADLEELRRAEVEARAKQHTAAAAAAAASVASSNASLANASMGEESKAADEEEAAASVPNDDAASDATATPKSTARSSTHSAAPAAGSTTAEAGAAAAVWALRVSEMEARAMAAERQLGTLEANWRELANENGAFRIELELSEKRLAIRNERIENLKNGLRMEKQNLKDMQDARVAEKRLLQDDARQLKTDVAEWRTEAARLKSVVAAMRGGEGADGSAGFATPNRTTMRFVRTMLGSGQRSVTPVSRPSPGYAPAAVSPPTAEEL
jgi:hypothetical protein